MKVEVFLKSGCDLPDINEEIELKDGRCIIQLTDDPDDIYGYKCNSKITWNGAEGKCKNCGATYYKGGE